MQTLFQNSTVKTERGSISSELSVIREESKSRINEIRRSYEGASPKKPQWIAFGLGGLVLLFLMSMFLMQVIAGALALGIVLVVIPAAFFYVRRLIALDPVRVQKLQNELMEQQITEAKAHNIEQITRLHLRKQESLETMKQAYKDLCGKIDQTAHSVDKDPDLKEMRQKALERLHQTERNLKTLIEYREKECARFEIELKKANEMKKLSQLVSGVSKANAQFDDKLEEFLSMQAFEQIEEDYFRDMAALEVETEEAMKGAVAA